MRIRAFLIPPASDEFFARENYHVLHDPRARVVYDDARHYILTAPEKFDVITTDPIHPWVKGTSTLYSKEYFELVRSHLNPGGVAAQWLPIYESDEETVRTELARATFFSDLFPTEPSGATTGMAMGTTWCCWAMSIRYPSTSTTCSGAWTSLNMSEWLASIADTGFQSAVDLLSTWVGKSTDLAPILANAQINGDINMRLQYIAGLGLNSAISPRVYKEILSYRRFPEDLFSGQGDRQDKLREH